MNTDSPEYKESAELKNILTAILKDPHGCPMCDSGKLRNPEKQHWPDCPFYQAENILKGTATHPAPSPSTIEEDQRVVENLEEGYDLNKLYEWVMDENRKPAQTHFTSSVARNIAKEIEYRLSHPPTPPSSTSGSIEQRAEALYPVDMKHCTGHKGMWGMCDINYYERQAFLAGASSQPDMKEIIRKMREMNICKTTEMVHAWNICCDTLESIINTSEPV